MFLDDASDGTLASIVSIVMIAVPSYQPISEPQADFDDRSGVSERTTKTRRFGQERNLEQRP